MVYVLDLTSPNGVFTARDFDIRDGDTVYVTEAPYNQFSKVLSAIVAPASTAASRDSLGEGPTPKTERAFAFTQAAFLPKAA